MARYVLMESYLMAYGYAKLMSASDDNAHLFARNFDSPMTAKEIASAWDMFQAVKHPD